MKRILKILVLFGFIFSFPILAYAHSGRTDSSGGHKDNNNKSGLGSYHYHCGGHPAHLHKNGVCPYDAIDIISISNIPSSLKLGDNLKLDCNVSSVNKTVYKKWTSSDNSIVSVSSDGTLSGKKIGSVTITLTTYNNSKAFAININPILAESISISNNSLDIQLNNTNKISAMVLPNNATDKTLIWTSDDESIATVSNDGAITGITVGTTNIKVASTNGIRETIAVKVYEVFPEKITSDTKKDLEITKELKVEATIIPENTNNKSISYESSNNSIFIIDANGKITPESLGEANIILKACNDITLSIPIRIYEINADTIQINQNSKDFILGKFIFENTNFTLDAQITPDKATYNELTWTSSNSDIIPIINNNNFKIWKSYYYC